MADDEQDYKVGRRCSRVERQTNTMPHARINDSKVAKLFGFTAGA